MPSCSTAASVVRRVKTPTTADVHGRHRRRAARRCAQAATRRAIDARDDRHDAFHQRRACSAAQLTQGCGDPRRPAGHARRCRRYATGRRISPTSSMAASGMIEGGHDYDGRPFMPLDYAEVAQAARRNPRRAACATSAVTAMFSPLDASDEEARRDDPARRDSRRRGHLLASARRHRPARARERGDAERRADRARRARPSAASSDAMREQRRRSAPLYLTQNDGTVARPRHGPRSSRSTASPPVPPTRCAAPPTSPAIKEAIVVDVGGTTADFGHLRRGFPREANAVGACRRRAHAVPHARPALDRARRRQPSSMLTRMTIGPQQRRLPPDAAGAGVRRRSR